MFPLLHQVCLSKYLLSTHFVWVLLLVLPNLTDEETRIQLYQESPPYIQIPIEGGGIKSSPWKVQMQVKELVNWILSDRMGTWHIALLVGGFFHINICVYILAINFHCELSVFPCHIISNCWRGARNIDLSLKLMFFELPELICACSSAPSLSLGMGKQVSLSLVHQLVPQL